MKQKWIRTLSTCLILCLVCSLASPALAASFPDVSGLSTEYRDAIRDGDTEATRALLKDGREAKESIDGK